MYDNYTYLLLLMQNKNMAYTSEVTYLGELRTEAVHLESGNKIMTDAPKDNHGKALQKMVLKSAHTKNLFRLPIW